MSINVRKANHKLLSKVNLKVLNVFPNYRSGGLEINGKYVGREFVYFPKRIADEVIFNKDVRAKQEEGEELELREKKWNKEERRFEFSKVKDKKDRDFFSVYKKVYDIEVVSSDDVVLPVWDKDIKVYVDTEVKAWETIILQWVPASRVKAMLELFELEEGIEKIQGKDKGGNDAMVLPYDWEDLVKDKLVGKFFSFKVSGEGLDTKYIYKEGKEFETQEEDNTFSAPVAKVEEKKIPKYADEVINIEDLPF